MIATTTAGKVQGLEKAGVLQFRGIPFASAERFRPPGPVEPWDGVREATEFGATSPQNPSPLESMLGKKDAAASEDCLFLNIYTPGLDGERPVMVWIHGGGFTAGSGAVPWYDGTKLATGGDVVVVTINYRLGAFGFLHVDDLLGAEYAGSGNSGIADQVAALEWVRDNIANFGGDPSKVTIFGESAGGMSTGTLLGTPSARGLFRAAIPQSGACAHNFPLEAARHVTRQMLRLLDLDEGSADGLLAVSVDELLTAQQALGDQLRAGTRVDGVETGLLMPFQPVIDGVVLPMTPLAAIAQGNAAEVSIVVGHTNEEWNLFHLMARQAGPLTDERLDKWTARILGRAVARDAIDVYRSTRPGASNDDIWCALGTDWVFRIPAIRLAETAGEHQLWPHTWMYRLSYRSTAFDGAMGAAHAVDIPFVFDNLHKNGVDFFLGGMDDQTLALGHNMSRSWLALANDLDPNHDGLPMWPAYDTARRSVMDFDRTCSVIDDPDSVERKFWDEVGAPRG